MPSPLGTTAGAAVGVWPASFVGRLRLRCRATAGVGLAAAAPLAPPCASFRGSEIGVNVAGMDRYRQRRLRFAEAMGEGVAVVFATPVARRNNDVEHGYRQSSDLYYLTGFDEPCSALMVEVGADTVKSTLFVRPRDPERETWDGLRAGVEGAVRDFGVDAARPIAELEEGLAEAAGRAPQLGHRYGLWAEHDALVGRALDRIRAKPRSGALPPRRVVCPLALLADLRLFKSDWEVEAMRSAAEVTRDAHLAAMRFARPGLYEYEVEAEMQRVFTRGGSERVAYESIVGSGPNATILHYRENRRRMQAGELLLIDAGCELGYYASDVTRTLPVGGRFTAPQRSLYEVVLRAQEASIEAVAPGATLEAIHLRSVEVITEGLRALGLISGDLTQLIEEGAYKPFFMHRTSHWLGMDVHDVGDYTLGGEHRPLEAGMVLTVEPGIYVSVDADVDVAYRGQGIRIEDDLLVTKEGHRNLTHDIPKEPDEIESIMAASARAGQEE